jgi:flagellar basal body-associated protein FliL
LAYLVKVEFEKIEVKKSIPMKTTIIVAIAILGIAVFGALVYAGNEENENKQKVAMTELSAAVQKTIQDNLGGGTVTETAKETKGDKTYYEAEVQKPGGEKVEIKVAEDGSLIAVEKEEEEDDD